MGFPTAAKAEAELGHLAMINILPYSATELQLESPLLTGGDWGRSSVALYGRMVICTGDFAYVS